jgi:RNA repair, ligase-Pnkp-associating, region of Hen1
MLLTITTTRYPATDLPDLLRVDPYDVRTRRFSQAEAMAFVPQYDEDRCTVAVLVQPRGLGGASRPSTLANALDALFDRVDPAAESLALPMQVVVPTLLCRDSEVRVRRLFEPLGYDVAVGADDSIWLASHVDVPTLLEHLRACLPLLDDQPARHCAHRASA